jgi:hypothetical protein
MEPRQIAGAGMRRRIGNPAGPQSLPMKARQHSRLAAKKHKRRKTDLLCAFGAFSRPSPLCAVGEIIGFSEFIGLTPLFLRALILLRSAPPETMKYSGHAASRTG